MFRGCRILVSAMGWVLFLWVLLSGGKRGILSGADVLAAAPSSSSPLAAKIQDSPYYFGLSCNSQGHWTAEALMATQQIRHFAETLQDDPHCSGFARQMFGALSAIQKEALAPLQRQGPGLRRMSQLPQEIKALRMFTTSDPHFREQILGVMMRDTMELGIRSSRTSTGSGDEEALLGGGGGGAGDTGNGGGGSGNAGEGGGGSGGGDRMSIIADKLTDFGTRISYSTSVGLSLLNQVLDTIPRTKECLKDPVAASQMLAGVIKTMAAFVGAGHDGAAGHIASSISKIGQVLRDDHFSDIFRHLNEQEFLTSISCLLEVSSESYCNVRDNLILLQKENSLMLSGGRYKAPQPENESTGSSTTSKPPSQSLPGDGGQEPPASAREFDPFLGYYVLTQHVPNITQWIQKIQIGVIPRTPNDAQFKNGILKQATDFYSTLNEIDGNIGPDMQNIRETMDPNQKRLQVLKLLEFIVRELTGEHFMPLGRGAIKAERNFFTWNVPEPKMLWFLMGMEDVIPMQKCVNQAGMNIPCIEWLQNNVNSEPVLANPDALMETVISQLNKLKAMATLTLIAYYNRWFIVDQMNIVGESLTSATWTIPESLQAIDHYLANLFQRITTLEGKDSPMLVNVMDTQSRIRIILAQYDRLRDLALRYVPALKDQALQAPGVSSGPNPPTGDNKDKNKDLAADLLSLSDHMELGDTYSNIINLIYDKFMVMLARTGFLGNRLENFVYYDYSLMIKSGVNFSDYESQLFLITGRAIIERLIRLYSNNPVAADKDLRFALKIHKGNMEAIEMAFKDNLAAFIATSKMVSEGRVVDWKNLNQDSLYRLLEDTWGYDPESLDLSISGWRRTGSLLTGFLKNIGLLFGGSFSYFWDFFRHGERYPTKSPLIRNDSNSPDDEFHTQREIYSVLCIQSLAFNDLSTFKRLCVDAGLKSPFPDSHPANRQGQLNVQYTRQLHLHEEDPGLNHSERICSYRSYLRRNLVAYITLGREEYFGIRSPYLGSDRSGEKASSPRDSGSLISSSIDPPLPKTKE